MGNASIASRAVLKALSSTKPWRTSWTTGRQVATSSRSTIEERLNPLRLRKTSIQTEVSTRSTGAWPGASSRAIPTHVCEIALPEARTGELQDSAGLDAPNVVLQRLLDGPRIGPFPAQARDLLQELLVKHKICTFSVFHVYRIRPRVGSSQGARRAPRRQFTISVDLTPAPIKSTASAIGSPIGHQDRVDGSPTASETPAVSSAPPQAIAPRLEAEAT
jgi:hypothetical protein